ncbi:MAG: hypothetical protein HY883_04345 [Deltaproteobacteria bacterium]|nr:hypothetical protein [Deltaproteobacteria bacterium]
MACMEKEAVFRWSVFNAHRRAIRQSYPSVYNIRIRKKLLDVIMEELKGNESILDVGASTRSMGEKVGKRFPSVTYRTMDIDTSSTHDYHSLDVIMERFDMVVLSEVVELLVFREGIGLIKKIKGLLPAGGKLVVSTPNVHHPNRFFDPDHKTPYRYDDMAGALLWAGFDVEKIYRIYNDGFIKRLIRLYVMAPVHRYFDVDFAKSVVVVALKR